MNDFSEETDSKLMQRATEIIHDNLLEEIQNFAEIAKEYSNIDYILAIGILGGLLTDLLMKDKIIVKRNDIF